MAKQHCVTVSITSESNGVLNQEVILREYAATQEELVAKNIALADAVVGACVDATREFAKPFLK